MQEEGRQQRSRSTPRPSIRFNLPDEVEEEPKTAASDDEYSALKQRRATGHPHHTGQRKASDVWAKLPRRESEFGNRRASVALANLPELQNRRASEAVAKLTGTEPVPENNRRRGSEFHDRSRRRSSRHVHGLGHGHRHSVHQHRMSVGGGRAGVEIQVFKTKSCESIEEAHEQEGTLTREMLYKEALYTGIHMLGKPSERFPAIQEDILTYVQVTFSEDTQEQLDYIQHVTAEAFPLTVVNVHILRGERLSPRDNNGLSDPYCLISVETEDSMNKAEWKNVDFGSPKSPKAVKIPKDLERPVAEKRFDQVYNTLPRSIRTTIEHQNLNPVWEQRFQCLALRPSHDILHVEVWDHDDEKEVIHAIQAATDAVKTEGVEEGKEIVKLKQEHVNVKEKHDDFIGKVMLKISDIPVEGLETWHYVIGKTHQGAEAEGRLLMQVWLTHTFRHGAHHKMIASPRAILERLWDFVLEVEFRRSNSDRDGWDGEIPEVAMCFLYQCGLQHGMSESTQAIIRFNAYAKRHLESHGAELRLKDLAVSLKKYDKVAAESTSGKTDHCDHQEMLTSLLASLRDPLLIISHHLEETQENVEEALKSFRHTYDIFERVANKEQVDFVWKELKTAIRVGALEWYQKTFGAYIKGEPEQTQVDIICAMVKVVRLIREKLQEGHKIWNIMFYLELKLDYLPVVYDEFQKIIIHDVEAVAYPALKRYQSDDEMRQILLRVDPEHKALCRCLFELYVETGHFVKFQTLIWTQEKTRKKSYAVLNEYHTWFRPALVLWLGFAFIRAHELIKNCIHHDREITTDRTVLTSSSAVDTVGIFHQLTAFTKELSWPDPAENTVVAMFIVEVMTYISIVFARLKRRKIEKEGYFDAVDRFDISERLCRALNNIQYIQETVQKAPQNLEVDKMLEELEEMVGGEQEAFINSRKRIVASISAAVVEIEKQLHAIVEGISDRVRKEIRIVWTESLIRIQQNSRSDRLEPLKNYLEENLRILHDNLFPANFVRLSQMFWILICQELVHTSSDFQASSTHEQKTYFQNLQSCLPDLVEYMQGNGEGITEAQVNCPDFEFLSKFLQYFTLDSEVVKALYFVERAKEQNDLKGSGQLGVLMVRVSYNDEKLIMQIISARNLTPMDKPSKIWEICGIRSHHSSDPFVEIEIIVDGRTTDIPMQKTKILKKSVNPDFNETFQFSLEKDVTASPYSVIRFTVKDFDVASQNDFLGEAFIPMSRIPGIPTITNEKHYPQPMNLQLRSVNKNERNPFLLVLKSRSWESDSQTFLSSQYKRCIESKN